MIRFKLDEMIEQIPAFHGKLTRLKAMSAPGKWRPWLKLDFITLQDEDTDKWLAWIKWELMEGKGAYPVRDAGKNEWISRMDPPERFPAEIAASMLAKQSIEVFREQYNAWIKSDFTGKEP
jgi:hypothetical protein